MSWTTLKVGDIVRSNKNREFTYKIVAKSVLKRTCTLQVADKGWEDIYHEAVPLSILEKTQ